MPGSANGLPRHVLSFGLIAAATMSMGTARGSDASPLGVWARDDGKALVRISSCEGGLCATNLWIKPGTPDEKAGDKLLLSVSPSGPATWSGEAYDPQRQAHFKIQIEAQEKEMVTRGCLLAGLLCKDVHWTRTETAAN